MKQTIKYKMKFCRKFTASKPLLVDNLVMSIKKKIITGFNTSAVEGFNLRAKANRASNIPGTVMNIVVTNGSDEGDELIMKIPINHQRGRVKMIVKPMLSTIATFSTHHTK